MPRPQTCPDAVRPLKRILGRWRARAELRLARRVLRAATPLVLAGLSLAWLIPATLRGATQRRYDWAGAMLLVAWLSAFLLAAARPEMEAAGAATGALLLGVLACFAAFLVHESRHDDPIIRPSLFQDPGFLVLNLASIAVNLAGFAVMLLVPFHLAGTAGLAPAVGGLVLGCLYRAEGMRQKTFEVACGGVDIVDARFSNYGDHKPSPILSRSIEPPRSRSGGTVCRPLSTECPAHYGFRIA